MTTRPARAAGLSGLRLQGVRKQIMAPAVAGTKAQKRGPAAIPRCAR
jgi:hypothetical protein